VAVAKRKKARSPDGAQAAWDNARMPRDIAAVARLAAQL
jgi:hypothetical protein